MLTVIELTTFLLSLQASLLLFINSSFLEAWVPLDAVAILYVVANALNILLLIFLPKLLSRYSYLRVLSVLLGATTIALLGLVLGHSTALIILFFLIPEAIYIVSRAVLDLYVEEFSPTRRTGTIRGMYLTIINFGGLLAPIIVAILVRNNNYRLVYLASAIVTVLALIIVRTRFRNIPAGGASIKASHHPFFTSWHHLWHKRDHRNIYLANFLLQFFFAWMTIYTPIYLHTVIGFSWQQIGVIFFVMLLPYVLIEIPLGKLADKVYGEKELLIGGFLITAIFTGILSFLIVKSVILWALILFATRLGTATIEVMSETYFFKHVLASDTGEISLFRDTKPLAYIIGPMLGALCLLIFPFQYLFTVLSIIMLLGCVVSLKLKDTK